MWPVLSSPSAESWDSCVQNSTDMRVVLHSHAVQESCVSCVAVCPLSPPHGAPSCEYSLGFKPLYCWRAFGWFSVRAAGEGALCGWRAGSLGPPLTAACGPRTVLGALLTPSLTTVRRQAPACPVASWASSFVMCAVGPCARFPVVPFAPYALTCTSSSDKLCLYL